MERMFGAHFVRYSKNVWREGDPEELKHIDHLGHDVWIGRYEGADELSEVFLRIGSGMLINDPGGCFIGVAYMLDRTLVVFAPSLSGVMSVERKNIDKWQSGKDILVNAQPDIVEAKKIADHAVAAWKGARNPDLRKELDDVRAAAEAALHVARDRVGKAMARAVKLSKKMADAEMRMRKEKKRVHQSIADFTLAFDRIVWPGSSIFASNPP
jgi:hypothetical protein